ncbi:MAG: type I methionyl aminopeptidase [Bacteroidales bacterium]|nr:type I methionyl aminopeptidase [Bacteroidales bacterium]
MGLIKSTEEIELIRISSLLVGKTLAEVAKHIQPGITTAKLDRIAEEFIRDHDAIPGFKGYGGFPGTLCTSVNNQVVHGIPGKYELKDGDIVSVDCGVKKNGYFGDSAFTFTIGEVDEEVLTLLKRTRESLNLGIEAAVAGNRVGDIGFSIQQYCESFGYGVVRDLVGHGLGSELHEKPEVPNFGRRGTGKELKEGMVLAIEPMINLGKKKVYQASDGWTIITEDGKPSAHFEHDIVVRKGKAEILSTFDFIDEILKNKN